MNSTKRENILLWTMLIFMSITDPCGCENYFPLIQPPACY